eukprot:TRINITY_DN5930_c0_g1_i1.p1 TRINITY_DN5930_c0_g1~~TRINITY_DN5930_c0_g1_i1.p1  ORF type:complete len:414 (-),score=67.42 TRINITY_DN5930_c0_g1_i1:34-1137(-)
MAASRGYRKTAGKPSTLSEFVRLLKSLTVVTVNSEQAHHAHIVACGEQIRKAFEKAARTRESQEDNEAHMDRVVTDFLDALATVAFDNRLVENDHSIESHIYVIARVPEPYKTEVRNRLITKVLNFLTVKRTVDCPRVEFFPHAAAFAALVKIEFVSVRGAVKTMTDLLRDPSSRCAAVTMLGKTVELCLNLLMEKCDKALLCELKEVLDSVKDSHFEYDIAYIQENMHWEGDTEGAPPPQQAKADQQRKESPPQVKPASAPPEPTSNKDQQGPTPAERQATPPQQSDAPPKQNGTVSNSPPANTKAEKTTGANAVNGKPGKGGKDNTNNQPKEAKKKPGGNETQKTGAWGGDSAQVLGGGKKSKKK